MSKKNDANVETTKTLRELMTSHSDVTLAKLADACDAPVAAVRAKSKQPISGQIYDAAAINYEAIEEYLLKRKPDLKLEELDWNQLNVKSEKATKVLKDTNIDFSIGRTYWLRYFKSNWTIVYETATHVCLMLTDGSSTQPKVMAKTTFISCGVKPAQIAEQSNEAKEQEGA